jgi:hypothetical protein
MLVLAQAAFAGSFTVVDPFNTVCATPGSASCDVIGANSGFDIQRGEFDINSTSAIIRLYFNYGPNATSLASFNLTPSTVLSLGDLFLSGNGFAYGLALQTHNTAVSGNVLGGVLYQINAPSGYLTASQALNNPSGISYRPDETVWLRDNGSGSISPLATGSVNVASGGNGVTTPEFTVTIALAFAAASSVSANLNALTAGGVHFVSATCGNDVMNGTVPEPATLGMIGAGLLLAAGVKFRKQNTAKN